MNDRELSLNSSMPLRQDDAVGVLKQGDPNYAWEQERITIMNDLFHHQNRALGILEAVIKGDKRFVAMLAMDLFFLIGDRVAELEAKEEAAISGVSYALDLRSSEAKPGSQSLRQLNSQIAKQQNAESSSSSASAFFRSKGGELLPPAPPLNPQPTVIPFPPLPTPPAPAPTPTTIPASSPLQTSQQQPIILQLPPSQQPQWDDNGNDGRRYYQQSPQGPLQQLVALLQPGGQFPREGQGQ
jgi:hypothetical protein